MPDFVVYLGDVGFQDFEVPDAISGGGAQMLAIHRYPGGSRTIDALGPDDAALTWAGTFLDSGAEDRCRALDAMRRQGLPVPLTWSTYSYQVVIESFTWRYRRYYQIEYSIALVVQQDNVLASPTDDTDDPDEAIGGDLDDASGDAATLGDPSLSSSVTNLGNMIGAVPSVTGAPTDSITAMIGSAGSAETAASGLTASYDGALTTAGDPALFASGTSAPTMIANIAAMTAPAQMLPLAFDASNKLTRIANTITSVLVS